MSCHPDDITVAIPSIPPRARIDLPNAIESIGRQTHPAAAVSVAVDVCKQGAPATRQRALDAVNTPLTAFLDDDDYFKAQHLERLLRHMHETESDYVYAWFDSSCGFDPFPQHFGKPFNVADPVETTITILIKTELVKEIGFQALPDRKFNTGEDWRLTTEAIRLGAKISHLPERTWVWTNDGKSNTSGLAAKW